MTTQPDQLPDLEENTEMAIDQMREQEANAARYLAVKAMHRRSFESSLPEPHSKCDTRFRFWDAQYDKYADDLIAEQAKG